MTNKITKKEMFEIVKANFPAENEHYEKVIEFINHEIELLDKKNTTKNKKVGEEQNEVKAKVLEVLQAEPNRLFKATEIAKELNFEYSVPKICPQLKKLIAEELVVRTEEKRTGLFQLVKVEG